MSKKPLAEELKVVLSSECSVAKKVFNLMKTKHFCRTLVFARKENLRVI